MLSIAGAHGASRFARLASVVALVGAAACSQHPAPQTSATAAETAQPAASAAAPVAAAPAPAAKPAAGQAAKPAAAGHLPPRPRAPRTAFG